MQHAQLSPQTPFALMDFHLIIFRRPHNPACVISVDECLEDKQFLLLLSPSLFFVSRWLSQHIAASCFRTARTGGLETRQPGSNHRPAWVRWDVALCSRCWGEIRQGEFLIFSTFLTAAVKFYSRRVWANDYSSVRGDSQSQTSLFIYLKCKWKVQPSDSII